MHRVLCLYCHRRPIRGHKRKYCDKHSAQASMLWKREHRRQWAMAGDKYWLADWKNKTEQQRRHYFRKYMRMYRRRRLSVLTLNDGTRTHSADGHVKKGFKRARHAP